MSVISRHGGILLRHRLEDYTTVSIANNYVGLSIFLFPAGKYSRRNEIGLIEENGRVHCSLQKQ